MQEASFLFPIPISSTNPTTHLSKNTSISPEKLPSSTISRTSPTLIHQPNYHPSFTLVKPIMQPFHFHFHFDFDFDLRFDLLSFPPPLLPPSPLPSPNQNSNPKTQTP